MSHAGYLYALTPAQFANTLSKIEEAIKTSFPSCNMLAGRGLSSVMIIPALAAKMGIDWAIVRKNDDSHSHLRLEVSGTPPQGAKIVIVDDLVCSGDTVKNVMETITARYNYLGGSSFLGGVLYADSHNSHINGVDFLAIK